jgi:anti-anti-sigma regulatory factor
MNSLRLERACCLLKLSNPDRIGPPLTEQIAPYLELSSPLILDVEGIDFNSMRIGELVNVYNRCRSRGTDPGPAVALVHLTPASRAAFERAHLDRLFLLCDSLADAVECASPVLREPSLPARGAGR